MTEFKHEQTLPWRIAPLPSKYYGTEVQFVEDGEPITVFKVWLPDHFAKPFASEREIANGWTVEDQGHDHVEDQQSYRLAISIVDHFNVIGFKLNT